VQGKSVELNERNQDARMVLVSGEICGGHVTGRKGNLDKMCIRTSCDKDSHANDKCPLFIKGDQFCAVQLVTSRVTVVPDLMLRTAWFLPEEIVELMEGGKVMPLEYWVELMEALKLKRRNDIRRQRVKSEDNLESDEEESGEEGEEVGMEIEIALPTFKPVSASELIESGVDSATADMLVNIFDTLLAHGTHMKQMQELLGQNNVSCSEFSQKFVDSSRMSDRLERSIGDMNLIINKYGSIANAVHSLSMEQSNISQQVKNCMDRIGEVNKSIEDLIIESNEEVALQFKQLADQVSSTSTTPSHGRGMAATPTPLSVEIFDDEGNLHSDLTVRVDGKKMSLADMFRSIATLQDELSEIRSAVEAKGGVRVGEVYFPSFQDLVDTITAEDPEGLSMECFATPATMWYHTKKLNATEKKNIQKLNSELNIITIQMIEQMSNVVPICEPYTGDKENPYVPGECLPAFKSSEILYGVGATAGQGKKSQIIKGATQARKKIDTRREKLLPQRRAPKLRAAAAVCATSCENWHNIFLTHCDSEKDTLQAMNLEMSDILLLFSEFTQLIFEYWHTRCVEIVSANSQPDDPVERAATFIWAVLRVHELVQEFTDVTIKHHHIIMSTFVRFLTRKTGDNSAAAVGDRMAKIERDVKSAVDSGAAAKREAVAAKGHAKSAVDALDSVVRKNDLKK
jgi:hypothetical protein